MDSGILGWYETAGATPISSGSETPNDLASDTITRSLGFARDPEDADVGEYTVTWTIADAKNPVEGAVQEGTFELEITDVYEEPVFSVTDFVEMTKENGVTGLERNTLAALLGENSRFSVQWDQWNLPGAMANPYRLKLEYRLAVTADSNKQDLYYTYPNGIPGTIQSQLFGLVSDTSSVSVGRSVTLNTGTDITKDGKVVARRFLTTDITNPGTDANADTVMFNLTSVELRASDYNEGNYAYSDRAASGHKCKCDGYGTGRSH